MDLSATKQQDIVHAQPVTVDNCAKYPALQEPLVSTVSANADVNTALNVTPRTALVPANQDGQVKSVIAHAQLVSMD